MDSNESFLMVSNYKSLSNWNLVPLRPLTVLLGPNSAGKSAVYEAMQIFRLFRAHEHLSQDEKYGLYGSWIKAKRDGDALPVVGISLPYSITGFIKSFIDFAEKYKVENYSNYGYVKQSKFPILSNLLNKDSKEYKLLNGARYTFVINEIGLDFFSFSCHINNEEVATFSGTRSLKRVEVKRDFFIKVFPSSLYAREFDIDFVYQIDNRDSSEEFALPNLMGSSGGIYPLKLPDKPIEKEYFDTAYALHNLLFSYPLIEFLSVYKFDKTDDVRELSSEWFASGCATNSFSNQFSTNKYCPHELFLSYVKDHISTSRKLNYLEKINYWLTHESFIDTDYELDIQVRYVITSDEMSRGFSIESLRDKIEEELKEVTHSDTVPIDFFARILLLDSTGRELNFNEVGSGFSQMIPILISLSQDKLLMYKQPELHLHPKLQSRIADCFVQVVNEHRGEVIGQVRMVETHSEHFVLRLLRRLRESYRDELWHSSLTLYPKDLALLYLKPTDQGTEIYQIRVDEMGGFVDKWPDGFFDEKDEDLL